MSDPRFRLDSADSTILNAAIRIVIQHEGFRQFPYLDRGNTIAIGHGTNLTRRGISTSEAYLFTRNDIAQRLDVLSTKLWWPNLNAARQVAILDMAYVLGDHGLAEFTRMLDDISRMDFVSAAAEILRSKFADEDKERAFEDSAIMRTGTLEVKAHDLP